jgi:hypothetical protein
MALDPMIARGVAPIDVTNTLAQVAALRQRDQSLQQDASANALMRERFQYGVQRDQTEDEEDELVADHLRNGRIEEAMAIDPESAQMWMQAKGIDPQSVFRNKQLEQDQSQHAATLQQRQAEQEAEQAYRRQQLAADQSYRGQQLALEREKEARLTSTAGAKTADNPLGLNDRQKAGMGMQRDNAIMYAASLTGTSRDEIEKILATEGPEGVERLVKEKGKRGMQGAFARVLQSFPLGKTIVEAKNADLIAPAKGGGAGIALLQNPSGPVATADFQAGEAQFPNATYPLETQAEMLRNLLKDGSAPTQSADPLAQHAGKVIRQGNKRYQVIQGRDGKFFAQELGK